MGRETLFAADVGDKSLELAAVVLEVVEGHVDADGVVEVGHVAAGFEQGAGFAGKEGVDRLRSGDDGAPIDAAEEPQFRPELAAQRGVGKPGLARLVYVDAVHTGIEPKRNKIVHRAGGPHHADGNAVGDGAALSADSFGR